MTRDRRTSDPRAADLLARFAAAFDVPQHPVPVDSVACDLLGLMITETDDIEVSDESNDDQRPTWSDEAA